MIIRKADKEDLPAITRLWMKLLDHHFEFDPSYERKEGSEEGFQENHLKKFEEEAFFVAEDESIIAGFIQCEIACKPPCLIHRQYGIIGDMYVLPNYRYKMVGYKLYQKCTKWFTEKNIKRIEVRVHHQNRHAASFWKSAGFKSYMEICFLELK